MRINKHDTNGTKPLLGKGELGYDDYVAGGDVGRVYVGTGSENIALAERLESNMMTKAQFNALAEERKANRAGSGFDEWGKHHSLNNGVINEGLWVRNAFSNMFVIGTVNNPVGISKSNFAQSCINGVIHNLKYVCDSQASATVTLPTAPNIYPYDTVLTAEQIASGVIKHADASNSGLIVNGKFDVDTSGWTALNATLSSVNGELNIALLTNDGGAYQARPTITGKTYIMEIDVISKDPFTSMYIANTPGIPYLTKALVIGKNKFEFTATSSTTYFQIHCGTTAGTFKFDNIAVYPADAISRSDLVFLESWHEDVSEKNFAYPLGNVQYLGGNTDGLTGITNSNFTGFETYSLFGNWQTPSALIGKGYVWSSLTEVQKRAFIANPENNCYLDGDKTIQVRYRVRVVQGLGDSWVDVDTTSSLVYNSNINNVALKGKLASITSDFVGNSSARFISYNNSVLVSQTSVGAFAPYNSSNSAYEGKCFALPIALVHRRNQGMYHNVYNPNGTKVASDGLDCFRTSVSFTSISDCFYPSKLLTASGYIGSVIGRPDGVFYDQVHESYITDLRNSSKKPEDYNRLISREFNKLVVGTTRGKEGEKYTEFKTQTTAGTVSTVEVNDGTRYKSGDVIYIYDLTASSVKGRFVIKSISSNTLTIDVAFAKLANNYMISGASATATKSNTLLTCDVIGNPTNYPASWKLGTPFFTTLHTAEDGTSLLPDGVRDTFKLSRKANATPLLCLRSTDSGATWTSFTPTFSTLTNAITLTDEPTNNLVMVYYQTKTSMAVPVVNSEVLEIGAKVIGANGHATNTGLANIANTLIGKTLTNTVTDTIFGYWNEVSFTQFPAIAVDTKGLTATARDSYLGKHPPLSLYPNQVSPAVKVFPYLTRTNGKAYLNLVFKEMKHNGTSWGDDNKFNIVDNVSTTTDNNAQTVLIGQKTVELPYFIGADE